MYLYIHVSISKSYKSEIAPSKELYFSNEVFILKRLKNEDEKNLMKQKCS